MQKLKSNRGASILMALLIFLLAAVVSGIILTAATSAMHHLRNDRTAQQNYLTVSSAAELIREEILQDSYARILSKEYTRDALGNETMTVSAEEEKHEGLLAPWLNAGIDGSNTARDTVSVKGVTDTLLVDIPVGAGENLQTVQAKFTMDPTAESTATKIVVELSLKPDGEREAAEDCRMTLTINGSKTDTRSSITADENKRVETVTTKISWNAAKITKGMQEGAA